MSAKSFTFLPTAQDLEAYVKNKIYDPKPRVFMKDYRALHHISGISDTSVAVYNAIRNLMSLNLAQKKFVANAKKSNGKNNTNSYRSGVISRSGVAKKSSVPSSIIGMSMTITDNMIQEWIGKKSRPTIKNALEQLEEFGFIKSSVAVKKNGRTVTLLRDIEDYQHEEIQALENCISSLGSEVDLDSLVDFLEHYRNSDELSGPFMDLINSGAVGKLGWNYNSGVWSDNSDSEKVDEKILSESSNKTPKKKSTAKEKKEKKDKVQKIEKTTKENSKEKSKNNDEDDEFDFLY